MVKAFQKKKDSVIEEGKRKKHEKETIKAMKQIKMFSYQKIKFLKKKIDMNQYKN